MSAIDHQCPNCGHRFNFDKALDDAKADDLCYVAMPKTLTGYRDINNPRLRCPACKQFMMDKDYEPTLPNS